jgi:hypothetical protein
MLGHIMKTRILKHSNPKKSKNAEAAYQEYKNAYECLSEINKKSNFWLHFDAEIYQLTSNEQRENGTLSLLKKQTELYYQKELKLGDTELKNPTECFTE